MSITEAERNEIYELIKEARGDRIANNVMSMFPPVGWADVATKHDFESLRKHDIESLRREMATKDDIARLQLDVQCDLTTLQARYVTWLLASQAVVVTCIAIATSVLIATRG